MYTLGVYLLGVLSMGLPRPGWLTTTYLLIVAQACYLLDRVKLTDSRQDPADALALPDRALFFARHSSLLRIVCVVELLVSSVLGYLMMPMLALIPLCALIGVYTYAGRGASPSKPRFKDLPALKSFFIASAHLALMIVVAWGNTPDQADHLQLQTWWSLVGLWLIVSADAIICDLDDVESDALYSTRSLPVLIGSRYAWRSAITMLLAGVMCLLIPNAFAPRYVGLAVAILLTAIPTRAMKNRRDLIDARLLPVVIIAMLMR
jgi:4-hydroxybenzoate polyprenyltransferase